MRPSLSLLLASFALAFSATAAAAQEDFTGRWTMNGAAPAAGEPRVYLGFWTRGLTGFPVPVASVEGLDLRDLARGREAVRLRVRRSAGMFDLRGRFADGRGEGDFTFSPDAGFADALAARGMERPTPAQKLSLALHDVGLAYLDELAAQGYARPSTAALVHAGSTGADLGELRALGRLGYRLGTLEALTRFHSSGVQSDYIRSLAEAGYEGLEPGDLRLLRNAGVDAAFVRRATRDAGRPLDVQELLQQRRERKAGVAREAGGSGATPLAGRWNLEIPANRSMALEIFWSDGTNWRRALTAASLRDLSSSGLSSDGPITFRLGGPGSGGALHFTGSRRGARARGEVAFVPNPTFGDTLRVLGVRLDQPLDDHDLKNLVWGGISAEDVRAFRELGMRSISGRQLIDMAIRFVTPEYVRALRELGVGGLEDPEIVTELRFGGVTPDFVRLAVEGGHDVSDARELLRLRERARRGQR